MDAKPQRPLRILRTNDENAVPVAAGLGKTVHQRHKSTPALSNLMQVGAIKGLGVKRAAFADVSNQRSIQIKDDSAIAGKPDAAKLKPLLAQVAETLVKDNALARRPQRAATLKAAPTTQQTQPQVPNASTAVTAVPGKPQPVPARSSVPKATNVVLRDDQPASSRAIVPVHEKQAAEQQDAKAASSQPILAHPQPLYPHSSVHQAPTIPTQIPLPSQVAPVSSYLPQLSAFPDTHELAQQALQAVLRAEVHAHHDTVRSTITSTLPLQSQGYYEQDHDALSSHGSDYTSRKSLGLLGDTTGGATVVLAPKYSAKIRAEIAAAKELVEASRTPEEIEDDHWDTSMVAEYGDEIFEYMRTLEDRMRPNPHYMDHQTECQWSMRAVLLDWLVQVHARFTLLPETLFLSVNYIDRFLSTKVVSLAKLQLVGATALFLAAKYEEVNCPSISEIVYMVDNGYTIDEILKAERFMLSMLAFELGWPGPMSFLRRISKADDYDLETRTLAKYFLEVTIMDERFLSCPPSSTSAAAHCLARQMLRKGDWTPAHVYYSDYTYAQLRPLIATMVECCENPMQHHAAVYQKYQDKRYKKASFFVQQELQNGFVPQPVLESSTHRTSDFGLLESITQGWRGLD